MEALIQKLREDAKTALQAAQTSHDFDQLKIDYLGKKGRLREVMDHLKALPEDQKKIFGPQANELKSWLESSIAGAASKSSAPIKLKAAFDSTLPALYPQFGRKHPITQMIEEIVQIFERLGFETVQGKEIETEFHNFTALNIPLDHPSRDGFDTFYTNTGELLRSQTSTVQIRMMQSRKPPLRIIAPGRVYRPDAVDASHSFMFHQVEGLMVDGHTTFAELKGTLNLVLRELFGADTKIRFRPHFFPFTEPSVEVDIRWGKGWLEILGAGSVDPNVFSAVGYDPKRVQGFAFGLGVERMVMLRYGIKDIRAFYENDIRFLEQFS